MKSRSAPKRIFLIPLFAMIVAQCEAYQLAQGRVPHQPHLHPAQLVSLNNCPVLRDFDGDRRIDRAELHVARAHRCVRIRFGDSRERHLELRALQSRGVLVSRDVNQDNNADLIWVSHLQSAPSMIWLGDGLGNFIEAIDKIAGSKLLALPFSDSGPGLVGDVKDEQDFLTPDPVSSELARSANLNDKIPNILLPSRRNDRCEPGLGLSYLRERGPPSHTSLV